MIEAAICTIGDEILIGQIVDTNSSHISDTLNKIGIKVSKMVSIQDSHDEIVKNLSELSLNNQVVIVTGGLGPTKDDITKRALMDLSDSFKYKTFTKQLDIIQNIVSKRGGEVNSLNRLQAEIPENCFGLENHRGTAPGIYYLKKRNAQIESILFSLPGVPYEMESLLPSVINIIKSSFQTSDITHKTVLTYGIPESQLALMISDWEESLPRNLKLAYLPNPLIGIRLRFSIYNMKRTDAELLINKEIERLKSIMGDFIYGEDSDTFVEIVLNLLKKNKKTLSIAESCTGGKVSSLITSIPGSSQAFKSSLILYSNESKLELLGVNSSTIEKHGAVSKECAEEMAKNLIVKLNTSYSLSITGIAGPDGGTEEKPVGMVWIAVSNGLVTESKSFYFFGDRIRNIERFSAASLNMLRGFILKTLV